MNTSRKILLAGAIAAAAALGMGSAAFAQQSAGNTATAHVNASASVVTPISISAGNDLKFGRIVVDNGATSATVVVSSDGSTVTTTNATQMASGTNAGTQVGSFSVSGEKGAAFSITLSKTGFTTGAVLSGLEHNAGGTPTIDATSGTKAFNVGGTLTVDSSAHGDFSGTVVAVVAYP